MKPYAGPLENPSFASQVESVVMSPMIACFSGEITANKGGYPVGAVRFAGHISDVWLTVEGSGKDDTNTLSMAANAYINGVSCLTTAPVIAHVSGEASAQKSTVSTGDTGITQAVVNGSANQFAAGDIITVGLTMTRTASPTTEMSNACIVVELMPDVG